MRASAAFCVVAALGLGFLSAPAAPEPRGEPDRSPIDLALLPDGRALTANQTSDTVTLVDLDAGKALAERPCGRRPAAVACSHDGRRAAVAASWGGAVSLFEIADDGLKPAGEIAVGGYPHAVTFAPDGGRVYVAVGDSDEIAEIDWAGRKVTHRRPAPHDPRCLDVSADGSLLAAAGGRSGRVILWDESTGKPLWDRPIDDAFNLRGLTVTPDDSAVVCSCAVRRDFPVSRTNITEGWVIDNRLLRLDVKADAVPPVKQISLDERGKAAGDLYGAAFDPKGRLLAVAGSGTGELLLLDAAAAPWTGGDVGDVLDPRLAKGDRFRRIPLAGRPTAVAFTPDGKRVVVANYLLNSVQIVDAAEGEVVRSISLGGPRKPSAARRGEALFYNATRSQDQWFSCSSCHVDGHTCGQNFDTLNDGNYGNPKLTPSLRGVARTPPWTWHGWQDDLGAAVVKSYTTTMFGPKPTDDETRDVVAFLETLDHPPNPRRGPDGKLSAAAECGRNVFAKAKCSRCHDGPEYTSERNYELKIEPDGSPYKEWNPPTLRGVVDRGPFLHDGRARTLDDVLTGAHAPEKLGAPALTPDERRDLIEFLKSL
jgi:DNA-binding beta-propeller fold protein YncE